MSETPSKAVLRLQSSIKQLQILKGSATAGELAQSFALDIETHELALAEIASLRAQLDEARRKAIEECILVVKKERRTKVIGPDASPRERAAWDKCRYGTFKSAEGAIRALLSESKT